MYGVTAKFVENLFCLFCSTNTVSPILILLAFVPRRLSAYFFPLCFACSWFSFASLCRFTTLVPRGMDGSFPLIFCYTRVGLVGLLWSSGGLTDNAVGTLIVLVAMVGALRLLF